MATATARATFAVFILSVDFSWFVTEDEACAMCCLVSSLTNSFGLESPFSSTFFEMYLTSTIGIDARCLTELCGTICRTVLLTGTAKCTGCLFDEKNAFCINAFATFFWSGDCVDDPASVFELVLLVVLTVVAPRLLTISNDGRVFPLDEDFLKTFDRFSSCVIPFLLEEETVFFVLLVSFCLLLDTTERLSRLPSFKISSSWLSFSSSSSSSSDWTGAWTDPPSSKESWSSYWSK